MHYFLIAYFLFLPFQFALNPVEGIDLASIRIITLVLFFSWLALSFLRRSIKLPHDKASLLLFSFFAIASISVFFSENISWALRKLAFLFTFFPLYLITKSTVTTHKKRVSILAAITIGATLAAIAGIVQFIAQFIFGIDPVLRAMNTVSTFFLGNTFGLAVQTYSSWLVHIGTHDYIRATATFPDPHMFSFYMGMTIPIALGLATTSQRHQKLYGVSAFLLFVADLLTFSRGGYIALCIAILIFFAVKYRNTKVSHTITAFILFFALLIAISPVGIRLFSSFDVSEGSNAARLSNWNQAITLIASHPLGVGIGNYANAINPTTTYRDPVYAHNLYLDVAAELGIVAALIFLAFFVAIIRLSYKTNGAASCMVVFSLIIFLGHSLFDTPLYSVHILPLVLTLAALIPKNEYFH